MEEKFKILDEIYHSPEGYCSENRLWELVKEKREREEFKEKEAIAGRLARSDVKEFYKSIAEVQRFKEPKPVKNFTHIIAKAPNDIHQMDLIEMDKDNSHKYTLSIIDVYSRFGSAIALKNKTPETIKEALIKAYEGPLMKFPNKIMVDQGREFNNKTVKELLQSRARAGLPATELLVNPTLSKRYTGMIERFNKTLERPIFLRQGRIELENAPDSQTDKYDYYPKWVEFLQDVIKAYNNRPQRLLCDVRPTNPSAEGKGARSLYNKAATPLYAMQNPEWIIYKFRYHIRSDDSILPIWTPVKIEQPGKKQAFNKRYMRETFSNKRYYIRNVFLDNAVSPLRYVLVDEEDNVLPITFYREELQVISVKGTAQTPRNVRRIQNQPEESDEELEQEPQIQDISRQTRRQGVMGVEPPLAPTRRKRRTPARLAGDEVLLYN